MKRSYLLGLLSIFFIAGTVVGVFAVNRLPFVMAEMQNDPYELILLDIDGSPISNFDWGIFRNGESRQFDCNLQYLGSKPGSVTWDSTDLSNEWSIEIWDFSHLKPRLWEANNRIKFTPGETCPLRIILIENDAIPNKDYSFVLNFISLKSGKE